MSLLPWLELVIWWAVWAYPFVFRAPHKQDRQSVRAARPTQIGLLFECAAIALAFTVRLPPGSGPGPLRIILANACGLLGAVLFWTSVTHLGRQFRIYAGLYHDHALVTTGPYSIVRHPIYASLLAMLMCTLLLLAPWQWMAIPIAVFILGTEIRVRCEDGLLASRFGLEFERYRKAVPAYFPLVR